jgi:Zn-dependent protease with chaperone function
MRSLLKPLAMVLAVPVIATVLGVMGRNGWETRWEQVVVRQLAMQRARPDARVLARYSLASICGDPRTGPRFPPCATYNLFSSVIRASAVVGAAGLIFLAMLVAAGRFYRARRAWLVRLFRPSLVLVAVGTSCLGLAHGLLAIAAVVVGSIDLVGEPIERVSVSVVMVAGTAGIVWGLAMLAVAFSLIRQPTISVVGQQLDLSRQRRFADIVREVSEAVGAEPPTHIVACLVPWLFVTEMKMACLDGRVSGRTLCLSLPLGRILSADEFKAQLAHELAHYSRDEVAFARRVGPALTGACRALRETAGRSRGVRAAAIAPPVALLSVFIDSVGGDDSLAGEHELAADRVAASAVGREPLASGLAKIAAFAPAWSVVAAMMEHAAAAGTQYVNASLLFHEIAASNAGDDRLAGVESQTEDHPTDRHHALSARLAALGLDLQQVASAALMTAPPVSAASLIDGYEAIERRLSAAEHQLILETGGEIPAV